MEVICDQYIKLKYVFIIIIDIYITIENTLIIIYNTKYKFLGKNSMLDIRFMVSMCYIN